MKTHICSLIVTILVSSACDNGKGLPFPTSPDPTPTSPTVYTLSGVITETTPSGPTPVEGVLVQDDFGHQTLTDAGGSYTLALAGQGNHFVTTTKDGYAPTYRVVALSADRRLDFQLSRYVTLSGVVFEMTGTGRVPIEGVELYCDGCGDPLGHTFAYTDADGHYRFDWTLNGATPLFVGKDGYALAGNQPLGSMSGSIVAPVAGDTRFDIELVRR